MQGLLSLRSKVRFGVEMHWRMKRWMGEMQRLRQRLRLGVGVEKPSPRIGCPSASICTRSW